MINKAKPIPEFDHSRFLSKINKSDKCWIWGGYININGYGAVFIKGSTYQAHRVAYSILKGELIPLMVIDHICRNRACVNPEHLRQVAMAINSAENSTGITCKNKFKTHCKNGHEFNNENIYRKRDGGRECRICRKNYIRKENRH